jgi:hypothetical protein
MVAEDHAVSALSQIPFEIPADGIESEKWSTRERPLLAREKQPLQGLPGKPRPGREQQTPVRRSYRKSQSEAQHRS